MSKEREEKTGTYRWFLIRVYKTLLDETEQPPALVAKQGTDIDDLNARKPSCDPMSEKRLRQLVTSIPQHVLVLEAKGSVLQ